MPNTIAVVLERDFGEKVAALAERIPVWLVDSALNRAAAEPIWARLKLAQASELRSQGVTLFQSPASFSSREVLADILDTIVEHHPGMTALEVYGIADPRLIEPALDAIRFVVSGKEAGHILCVSRAASMPSPAP